MRLWKARSFTTVAPLPWDGAGGDFGAVEGGDCGDGVCCDGGHGCWPGDCCCPTTHFWARAEYLIWNMKDNHYPALVTTVNPSSLINTGNPPSRGALGQAGTEVLFGGSIDPEEQSGGRFTVGGWLDACENWGLEGTYLFLGSRSVRFSDSSTGIPLLARPFLDVSQSPPVQSEELVANPALAAVGTAPARQALIGSISVRSTSELQGGEVNGIMNLGKDCCGRLDLIGGFRFLELRESLNVSENLLVNSTGPAVPGTTATIDDGFGTLNRFYGGQVGLRDEWRWGRWQLDLTGKIALGVNHETVDISGVTAGTAPVLNTRRHADLSDDFQRPGGLLAQSTNIGHHSNNAFAAVPELGLNFGYQINDHWRAFVGYNVLYASHVERPSDQINTAVNPTPDSRDRRRHNTVGPRSTVAHRRSQRLVGPGRKRRRGVPLLTAENHRAIPAPFGSQLPPLLPENPWPLKRSGVPFIAPALSFYPEQTR